MFWLNDLCEKKNVLICLFDCYRSHRHYRDRDSKHSRKKRDYESRHGHSSRYGNSRSKRSQRGDRSERESNDNSNNNNNNNDNQRMDFDKKLEEMVRKGEQEAALAVGKEYARRPTSYKTSLTLPHETSTNRKRSPTPPLIRAAKREKPVEKEKPKQKKPPSKEQIEKMRLLRLKYGDASQGPGAAKFDS